MFCLFVAVTTSSTQQDPASASSQDQQETGLHRFRNCTVKQRRRDSRTKRHNAFAQDQLLTHTFLDSLSRPRQDEYLTAAPPPLIIFSLLPFCFYLQCEGDAVCRRRLRAATRLDMTRDCVQTDKLGPTAFRYHVYESAVNKKNHDSSPSLLFLLPLCTEVCI